jgi:hypothetical protein
VGMPTIFVNTLCWKYVSVMFGMEVMMNDEGKWKMEDRSKLKENTKLCHYV